MLDTIRDYLWVSNSQLAAYLNTSVHTMAAVSCGRRPWQLEQLQAVQKLYDALEAHQAKEQDLQQDLFVGEEEGVEQQLTKQTRLLEHKLMNKRTAHEKLIAERVKCLVGLQACNDLLASETAEHKNRWIERRKRQLLGKLKEQSQARYIFLQADIAGLEAKLAVLNSYRK